MSQPSESAEAINHRGLQKRAKGDLDGALADYSRAIELKPDLAAAWTYRAAIRRENGDLPGALADRNTSLELNP